ncbi:MAG: 2-oxo acid dehydrogenase subunit E2, partial [Bacteroidota bacterium]
HTTVMSSEGKWVEIQIRSARMDDIAERGFAAHWKYKGDGSVTDLGLDDWLARIREWLQNPDSNALDFLDDFKLNLFSDEIYVFTPKGDIKTLPAGSSTLDFAYNIHSQVGNTAIGAKVNYRLEPLNKKLSSGDQVEIISSKKQKPKEEWYNWVTTARAKTQIKLAIKENRKKYLETGRRTLRKHFRQLKIDFNDASIKARINFVQEQSEVDFFYKIAIDEINMDKLKAFSMSYKKGNWLRLIKKQFSRKNKTISGSLYDEIRNKLESKPEQLLLGQDIGKMNYALADCCNPIPGDDVIGFIKPGKGLEVHRTNCPRAIERMSTYGKTAVKAKWKETPTVEFLTGIKINGIDKIGLVNDIIKIISEELNVNIRSLEIKSHDGLSEGVIMLYISNTDHLKNLINKLEKVEGTGPGNRITTDDVKSYAKAASKGKKTSATATLEMPDFSRWGETERKSMNRIRQITAESMITSWQNIPQVTQFDEADVTELEAFRQKNAKKVEKAGGKLTVTSMLVKICALALEKFPRFNASIDYDNKEIILKKYYNVGLAVDTPQGLLVPVVRDVDKKSMTDISVEVTEMAKKAREKKLGPDAMQGGNFTISNLGGIGGTNFTPIVYSPQVAILGLSRATQRVVSTDEGFEERTILPLSLTYDHRIIDGADGARFLRWIAEALENPLSIYL